MSPRSLQELLHPLCTISVQFTYCHDRPLQTIATRYTNPAAANQPLCNGARRLACTLLLVGGISLNQETWLPVIKRLFQRSQTQLLSIWAIERPNHGDAAILNEQTLTQHYSVLFPSLQYAAAIRAFLQSDYLSASERANLIGIGHSGGGGSIIQAMEPATSFLPLSGLILVESPHVGPEAMPNFAMLYQAVKASNARRQTSWASTDEALAYFKNRIPWKQFHPDVLEIVEKAYFRPEPGRTERVTTKTTVEQETACFLDDGTHLDALPYLEKILHILPTHLIVGSVRDIWPPAMYQQIDGNIARNRRLLASVSTIDGVGHYVPVQEPEKLATHIVHILDSVGHSSARL